jgi:hypothetical protein
MRLYLYSALDQQKPSRSVRSCRSCAPPTLTSRCASRRSTATCSNQVMEAFSIARICDLMRHPTSKQAYTARLSDSEGRNRG